MSDPIVIDSRTGKATCRSAGMIVRHKGKILMLDRRKGVLGWACPAGHVEDGEYFFDCLLRELEEETGLKVSGASCVLMADINNACKRGATAHYWEVYECSVDDPTVRLMEPDKHNGIGWFTPDQLLALELEPVWKAIFRRLGIFEKPYDFLASDDR